MIDLAATVEYPARRPKMTKLLCTRPAAGSVPDSRGRGFWQLSVPEAAAASVWLPVESPCLPERTAPRPGAFRNWGRACSFARHGISVALPAIYKARQTEANIMQRRNRRKQLRISHLLKRMGIGGLTVVVGLPVLGRESSPASACPGRITDCAARIAGREFHILRQLRAQSPPDRPGAPRPECELQASGHRRFRARGWRAAE
jgi:hypothetical protein